MATGMDGLRGPADSISIHRLDRTAAELEAVLEQTDLERDEQLVDAVIDAIEDVERARRAVVNRSAATSFSWGPR
jgi:HPt (histidine-containing phosphotransfer) domain-containing protein